MGRRLGLSSISGSGSVDPTEQSQGHVQPSVWLHLQISQEPHLLLQPVHLQGDQPAEVLTKPLQGWTRGGWRVAAVTTGTEVPRIVAEKTETAVVAEKAAGDLCFINASAISLSIKCTFSRNAL